MINILISFKIPYKPFKAHQEHKVLKLTINFKIAYRAFKSHLKGYTDYNSYTLFIFTYIFKMIANGGMETIRVKIIFIVYQKSINHFDTQYLLKPQ